MGTTFELAVFTGTKLPPTSSVWKPAAFTMRRPFSSTRVLPVPRLRRLNAPTSPRAEFTPPLMFSASLKKFWPCSGSNSSRSSPDSTPNSSICSLSKTDTGKTPLMFAPLMCVPVTTTSSMTSFAAVAVGAASSAATAAAMAHTPAAIAARRMVARCPCPVMVPLGSLSRCANAPC